MPQVPLTDYLAGQVANPTLPTGATLTPVTLPTDTATLQSTGQLMNPAAPGVLMNTGGNIPTPTPIAAPTINTQQGTAAQVNQTDVTNQIQPSAATYDATTIGQNAPQATAEQGVVNPNATVKGQLENLYAEIQPGTTPAWAQGAVNAANEMLAARNLGASTIGGAAIAAAIQGSAINIAAQDASVYFQMDMTNLSNRQQTQFANLQSKQQAMLSDQAAENASKQFNASSTAQLQQFMSTLVSNIQTQNADRLQSMSQFNVGQANQAAFQNVANQVNLAEFNAQQQAAIDQFNAQQSFAREQFNSNAAFAIEQSNVLWRRNINTENTAAINAANQTNVQNAYNLSATAQNQLWQAWRDEASYAFTASENQKNRDFNAAMAANNRQFNSGGSNFNWGSAVGSFVSGLLI